MHRVVVIGTGGLAREFTSWFHQPGGSLEIVGYASTNHEEHARFGLPGCLFSDEIAPENVGTQEVVIAIADPAVRQKYAETLAARGFVFPSLAHPSSVVSGRAELAEGVVVSPNCVVSTHVRLEKFCYLNFGCGIGHDTFVGAYTQINPGAQVAGRVTVGEGVLIGSGSVVLQDVKVGARATVASGAVVFSRVAEGATVMGNPAKRMRALEE